MDNYQILNEKIDSLENVLSEHSRTIEQLKGTISEKDITIEDLRQKLEYLEKNNNITEPIKDNLTNQRMVHNLSENSEDIGVPEYPLDEILEKHRNVTYIADTSILEYSLDELLEKYGNVNSTADNSNGNYEGETENYPVAPTNNGLQNGSGCFGVEFEPIKGMEDITLQGNGYC